MAFVPISKMTVGPASFNYYHAVDPSLLSLLSLSLSLPSGFGNPTSVDFVWTNSHQMAASYQASKIVIYDVETGQSVVNLDSGSTYGKPISDSQSVYAKTVIAMHALKMPCGNTYGKHLESVYAKIFIAICAQKMLCYLN